MRSPFLPAIGARRQQWLTRSSVGWTRPGKRSPRREAAQEQQDAAQRFAEDRERRLGQAQKELDDFLSFGGTDDPEDFRVRARAHEGRLEFERRRDELIRSMERLSGPGDRLDAFREQLAGTDQIQMNEESNTVSERFARGGGNPAVDSRRSADA